MYGVAMDFTPEDTNGTLWYESLIERFEAHGWVLKTDLSRFPSTTADPLPQGDHIRLQLPETTASLIMTLEPGRQPSPKVILEVPVDPALEVHDPVIEEHPFTTALTQAHRSIAVEHAVDPVQTYADATAIASATLGLEVGSATAEAAVRALTEIARDVDQLHTELYDLLDAHRVDQSVPVEEGVRAAFGLDLEE